MTVRDPCDLRVRAAFDAHADRLLRVLNRAGIGQGDAEDVVQDAFCVFARRLTDVPKHAERAFLVGTALRMASALRRSSWHQRVSEPLDPDLHAQPCEFRDEDFDVCSSAKAFQTALDSLPDEERTVFVLGELEQLSRREVARVLSLPEGTVATRLSRGRAAFERGLYRALRQAPLLSAAHLAPRHFRASRMVGAQRYENNCYRANQARGSFDQRLVTRRRAGRTQVGWTWRWPGLDPQGFAFPEVVRGWKPWYGGPSTDPAFPIRVDRARRLLLHYATETFALGSYNLAADLWFIDALPKTVAADPDAIASEVMVIVDHSRGARPHGTLMKRIMLAGEPFELWHAPKTGGCFRRGRSWPLLTFQSQHAAPRGTLNLQALVQQLVDLGFVRPDQYIASIELGNEIYGGAGTTWISHFEVETAL